MINKPILLFYIFLLFTVTAFAQPKTVTDFYLAMPSSVYSTTSEGNEITNKNELIKYRRSLIKIEDIKNGYLRLEGAWEGWSEIVLFKKTDGSYIIAESKTGCGPGCEGSLKFQTFKNNKWTDVTKEVWTDISFKEAVKVFNSRKQDGIEPAEENDFSFYYLLPRYGKTLKIACNMCSFLDGDFVFMQFDWNGSKFVRKLNWK